MTDIFGPIRSGDDLENAVVATLEEWWEVHAQEYELQHGITRGALARPKSWTVVERLDRDTADNLPAVVVVSPGLSGKKPIQQGDGTYRAFFNVGVGVFVGGPTRNDTKALVRHLTAIARTTLIKIRDLNGFADGLSWLDESYDDNFKFTDTATIGLGVAVFEVEVSDVDNRYGGPAVSAPPDPATQPGSDWPTVTEININLTTEGN